MEGNRVISGHDRKISLPDEINPDWKPKVFSVVVISRKFLDKFQFRTSVVWASTSCSVWGLISDASHSRTRNYLKFSSISFSIRFLLALVHVRRIIGENFSEAARPRSDITWKNLTRPIPVSLAICFFRLPSGEKMRLITGEKRSPRWNYLIFSSYFLLRLRASLAELGLVLLLAVFAIALDVIQSSAYVTRILGII